MDSTILIGDFAIFHYPLLCYRKGQNITIPEDAVAALVYNGDVLRALWPGDLVTVPKIRDERGRSVLWLMSRKAFDVQLDSKRSKLVFQFEVVNAKSLAVAVLNGHFSQGNALEAICQRACRVIGKTPDSVTEKINIEAERIGIQCLNFWRV